MSDEESDDDFFSASDEAEKLKAELEGMLEKAQQANEGTFSLTLAAFRPPLYSLTTRGSDGL